MLQVISEFVMTSFWNIQDIFLANPRGQWIWFLAFLVAVYNFWFCKDQKFIVLTWVVSILFGFHFVSLWLMTAGVINFLDAFKNFISLRYEKNIYRVIGLSILYICIWYFTYDGYLSLIPLWCAIFSTFLVFYIRGIWLNIWFMLIILSYMVYNYMWNSLWGFSTDVFLLFFGLYGIWKQLREKKIEEIV